MAAALVRKFAVPYVAVLNGPFSASLLTGAGAEEAKEEDASSTARADEPSS